MQIQKLHVGLAPAEFITSTAKGRSILEGMQNRSILNSSVGSGGGGGNCNLGPTQNGQQQ